MSVNTPVRIIQKPETENANESDYVLIDSEILGTRIILVSNLTNIVQVNYNQHYNNDNEVLYMGKGMLDYPKTTEVTATDYLLVDSATQGTRKILVVDLVGGGSSE